MWSQKEEKQRPWIIHTGISSFSMSKSHSLHRLSRGWSSCSFLTECEVLKEDRFPGILPSSHGPRTTMAIDGLKKWLLNLLHRQLYRTTRRQLKVAVTDPTPTGVPNLRCGEGRDFFQWKQLHCETARLVEPHGCETAGLWGSLGREAPVLQLSSSVAAHLVVHREPILQLQKGKCSLPWQLKEAGLYREECLPPFRLVHA